MHQFFVVDVADRRLWFDILYMLAFLLAYGMLFYLGRRRGYPLLAWLLMLASGWLLFVIGCKLPTYTAADWVHALNNHALPPTTKMTVLGGLLLGSAGIFFGRWWSRLPLQGVDLFAIVLPLCMVVQRLGCLVVGCCYGVPSSLPWSVKYPAGTLAHAHQYETGLIGPGDLLSLAVHPTQVYEQLAALCTIGLVWGTRRYWKVAGNVFLSSLLYYGGLRFITEFFRADSSFATADAGMWDLSRAQTGLMFLLPLLLLWMLRRETICKIHASASPVPPEHAIGWNLLFIFILVSVFWLLRDWLLWREILVLNIAFIPLIAVAAIHIFHVLTVPSHRWLTASVLLLSLFLMSQTLIPAKPDSGYLKTYKTISLGYGLGDYRNSHDIGTGEGCDRISNKEYFRQEYSLAAAGFSVTREKEKESTSYGINVYGGRHTETSLSSGGKDITDIFGLNPYIRYDRRYIGIGAGLHIGRLVYTLENLQEEGVGVPETAAKHIPFYPQIYVQAGPRDIAFVKFQLAEHFPSALPGFRYKLSIGSGFGFKNGTNLQFGTNTLDPFISAYVPLKDRIVVESLYLWRSPNSIDPFRQRQFSLGLHYRFGHKETGVKQRKQKSKDKKE